MRKRLISPFLTQISDGRKTGRLTFCIPNNIPYFCNPFLKTDPEFGTWRSPVAHLYGVQGVASSNLVVPTNIKNPGFRRGFAFCELLKLA